jgi:hypothetical protein
MIFFFVCTIVLFTFTHTNQNSDPWPGISATVVASKVMKGERMQIPINSPPVIASLMEEYVFFLSVIF